MKKILVFISVLCICLMVKASDDVFINALRTCSNFRDSGTVNTEGVSAKTTKQITGWHDGKCTYKENIKMNGLNINMTCHFTKAQIQEITSVADAYYLTLKYSQEQTDLSSPDAAKNNPLANVFNKYLQDQSVCEMNGLQ